MSGYACLMELVRPDQRRLVVRSKRLPDVWMFPGGRAEPDDPSPRRCVMREIHEELGFVPDEALLGEALYVKGDRPDEAEWIYFWGMNMDDVLAGKLVFSPDLLEARWASLDGISRLTMLPAMRSYVARAMAWDRGRP